MRPPLFLPLCSAIGKWMHSRSLSVFQFQGSINIFWVFHFIILWRRVQLTATRHIHTACTHAVLGSNKLHVTALCHLNVIVTSCITGEKSNYFVLIQFEQLKKSLNPLSKAASCTPVAFWLVQSPARLACCWRAIQPVNCWPLTLVRRDTEVQSCDCFYYCVYKLSRLLLKD